MIVQSKTKTDPNAPRASWVAREDPPPPSSPCPHHTAVVLSLLSSASGVTTFRTLRINA